MLRTKLIRAALETLFFSGIHTLVSPLFRGVGAVLMLHHVRPPRFGRYQPNRSLEVAPDFLETVIGVLRDADIDLISLDEMHRRMVERRFGRRFACITLDDGYRDNKQWAYPIFKRHEVPFAIYVPTSFPDRLGKLWWIVLERVIAGADSIALLVDGAVHRLACAASTEKQEVFDALYWWLRSLPTNAAIMTVVDDLARRYGVDVAGLCEELCMSWNEIAELAADPLVTIGAHTVNHTILAKDSDAVAGAEIRMGQAVLHAALGQTPRHFAYPFGDCSTAGAREFRAAAQAGFSTAVTTRPGVLFAGHTGHLLALPRISLNGEFQRQRYVQVLLSGAGTAVWNRFRRLNVA